MKHFDGWQSDQLGHLFCSDGDLATTHCHLRLYLAVTTQRSKPWYFQLVLGFFFSRLLVRFNMELQPLDNMLAKCSQLCETKLIKNATLQYIRSISELVASRPVMVVFSYSQSTGINAAVYTGCDLHSSHIHKSKTRMHLYTSHLLLSERSEIL